MWCIAVITPEYRNRMYGLLNLYGCAYNAQYPVICMDEKSKQLLEDKRRIIPMKPGSPEKYDGEYKRMGTQNIFVAVEPLAGKRYIKVTDQRKKADFAQFGYSHPYPATRSHAKCTSHSHAKCTSHSHAKCTSHSHAKCTTCSHAKCTSGSDLKPASLSWLSDHGVYAKVKNYDLYFIGFSLFLSLFFSHGFTL
jgi:DDE superfamily endonuclease